MFQNRFQGSLVVHIFDILIDSLLGDAVVLSQLVEYALQQLDSVVCGVVLVLVFEIVADPVGVAGSASLGVGSLPHVSIESADALHGPPSVSVDLEGEVGVGVGALVFVNLLLVLSGEPGEVSLDPIPDGLDGAVELLGEFHGHGGKGLVLLTRVESL